MWRRIQFGLPVIDTVLHHCWAATTDFTKFGGGWFQVVAFVVCGLAPRNNNAVLLSAACFEFRWILPAASSPSYINPLFKKFEFAFRFNWELLFLNHNDIYTMLHQYYNGAILFTYVLKECIAKQASRSVVHSESCNGLTQKLTRCAIYTI